MTPNELVQLALQLLAFHANADTASDAVTPDDERRALDACPHVRDIVAGHSELYPLKWLKKTSFAAALAKFRAATGGCPGPPSGSAPHGRGRPCGRPRSAAAAAAVTKATQRRLMAQIESTQGPRAVWSPGGPGREENDEVQDYSSDDGEDPLSSRDEGYGSEDHGITAAALQDARSAEAEHAL